MQRGRLEVKQLVTTLRSFFSGEGVFQDLGLEQLPERYVWPKKGEFPSFGTTSFEGTNYQILNSIISERSGTPMIHI